MFLITAVVFVLIFSFLILIHELGHFAMAKKAGVKVEEFGFGLPPRMFGIKKGETIYSINWIPFGGFVRMLGEDSSSKDKRSFGAQPLLTQTKIVCAGVFMNLLLSFVLLTFGFVIGIQPLIASVEDFYQIVREGQVELQPGVEEEGAAYISRLTYLADESSVFAGSLESGDVILQIDGEEILNLDDLTAAIHGKDSVNISYFRKDTGVKTLKLDLPYSYPVISYVEPGSPAEIAGLMEGDKIQQINGEEILSAEAVVQATGKNESSTIRYFIIRGNAGQVYDVAVREEDKRVGIAVTDLLGFSSNLSLYSALFPEKIVKIQDVKYGLYAPIQALKDMWHLGKLTAVMFVNVLGNFVSGDEPPEGVSGPVGIAQMTYVFLQDGFAAIIRFIALLSLSLGVINILPFPALDGGRFAFIAIQAVTGKKPNPKIETLIHSAGFVFLLLFIAYVTFNDILRIF